MKRFLGLKGVVGVTGEGGVLKIKDKKRKRCILFCRLILFLYFCREETNENEKG